MVQALRLATLIFLFGAAAARGAFAGEPLRVHVTVGGEAAAARLTSEAVSGRLYLFVSVRALEPRFGPDWFHPEPFFRLDIADLKSASSWTIDDRAAGFPVPISKLSPAKYRIQAVLDDDFYHHHPSRGPGNSYSEVREWEVGSTTEPAELVLNRVASEPVFPETEWVKEVVIESQLLSDFHGRKVLDRAAVILPTSYLAQPDRRYPVMYIVPGFGRSHRDALRYAAGPPPADAGEVEFIRVMLSGDCKWGHHVYADSATNGPRGQSLVSELIPQIDRQYRTVAAPTARFLSGHSSGGWSSLWLQIAYPDVFGGVWSTSPDPVDFRDYQQVNLYADPPLSLYANEQGGRRPIARRGTEPVLWYDDFGRMDDVLERGGQLRSFEAVFSPLDENRLPKKLWDRETGRIDPQVAKAWEQYDIRLKIERDWPQSGPKLQGKLHIITGSLDTFYLEGAVRLLADSLRELGSDAEVTVVEGKDHFNLISPQLVQQMRQQASASFLKHHHEAQ